MRLLGIIAVMALSLFAAMIPARAAEETSGAYVCVEVDEDGACTSFAPVLQLLFESDGANPGLYVGAALALVLGIWLLGLAIGAVWRFLDAALGGPLS